MYYSQFLQEDEIAKRVYCCDGAGNYFTNCLTQGGCDEGLLYKGKGFIQLTWKSNYIAVNNILKEKVPEENIDIENNPNSVLETKIGLLSAMGFWKLHNMNDIADNNITSSDPLTAIVNLNTPSYDERQTHFDEIYTILKGN